MPILEGRGSKAGVPGVAVASLWAHGPIRQYRSAGYSCIQTTRLCRVPRVESQLTYTDAHYNPNPRPLRASHLLAVIRVNSLFLHQSVIATTTCILLQPPTERIYMHTAIWGQLPFSRNPQRPMIPSPLPFRHPTRSNTTHATPKSHSVG